MLKIAPMKPASNLCIVLCLPLLHACTGIGAVSGNMPLEVESVPSGATVTIMDKNLGETPLRITQQQIYPAAYDPAQQQRYGEILIKKKGCRDYRKRISYRDFNQGLTVELDCGDIAETHPLPSHSSTLAAPRPATGRHASEAVAPNAAQPVTAQDSTSEQGPAETNAKANGHQRDRTIKQRLIRLDNLKRDGLISEEEYRQARERILEAL